MSALSNWVAHKFLLNAFTKGGQTELYCITISPTSKTTTNKVRERSIKRNIRYSSTSYSSVHLHICSLIQTTASGVNGISHAPGYS